MGSNGYCSRNSNLYCWNSISERLQLTLFSSHTNVDKRNAILYVDATKSYEPTLLVIFEKHSGPGPSGFYNPYSTILFDSQNNDVYSLYCSCVGMFEIKQLLSPSYIYILLFN